jgi:acetyltransferase-like isoleucine patch superfamily enzyme
MIGLTKRLLNYLHRQRDPVGCARKRGARIGENCRLIDVTFGSEPWLVTLGNHVSATQVSFITHDGGVWVFREEFPDIDVLAPIRIGNNVFLGAKAIVLPGVTIGSNVVVGAGSIVTRDIPDNCVAAGVPAKVLGPVSEYRQKTLEQSENTKQMDENEKRLFYERKFLNSDGL